MNMLARHWAVLSSAWSLETERAREKRRREQTEFLPAALEVIETPASPFGRIGLWLLIGGVGLALIWAVVGRLDVVVVAPGRTLPADRVKIVQPSDLGVVRAIHVRDGQQVRAGQLLIELDPTAAGADDAQARTGLVAAEVDRARSRALLSYLAGRGLHFSAPPGVPGEVAAVQRDLVRSQVEDYEARRGVLLRERGQHAAELSGAQAEIAKIGETLPLLDRQLDARRSLADKGHFSRLRVLELEEERIERVRNIEVQQAAAARAREAMGGIDAQIAQLRSELLRSTVKDLADAQDNADLRSREIEKTDMRRRLMQLRAPVDGTVQQLAVHTLGGVVQPAEALMVIVPRDGQLVVEAMVPNKDVGFLRAGQPVRIKIEAFPFTDHGTVDGRLESISPDAIEDEQRGLVYSARVRILDGPGGRPRLPLTPGMAVTAEIKTASRRVIQYLLSPIMTRIDEAGREQ
ncbi:MAG: HlyD family type I secretion periplasmic adaptor subunit [Allosphingosinicella sp.]|uniref:HlyD family type I secretion periplasmic adaptor subunit n=1 Tax=Allosphingosinicella sp. TaxID=2823234 RepID=UPI003925B0B4